MVAESKWVMTKVAAGDYLLPSNDAQTIWRLVRYTDGPSFGLDWSSDRDQWCVRRWSGDLDTHVDIEDGTRWEGVADGFDTRSQAIEYALAQEYVKLTPPGETGGAP